MATTKITEADGYQGRYTSRAGKTATYRVLYYGPTKHGERAKLCMSNGKSFWVDASDVDLVQPGHRATQGSYGQYCYYPCPVTGRKCCPENGPCHDCF